MLLALVLAAVAVVALVTKRPMTVALGAAVARHRAAHLRHAAFHRRLQERRHGLPEPRPLWLRIAGGISAVAALAGALLNPDRKRVSGVGRPSRSGRKPAQVR